MEYTLDDLINHPSIRMVDEELNPSNLHLLNIVKVVAISRGAALLNTTELEEDWFPFSQLRVDTQGLIYCTDWLWKKKS